MARSESDGRLRICPETRAELRAWLQEHHASSGAVWLVQWKQSSGRARYTYEDVVEELLCFGWIDSTVNRLDDERGLLLIAPRKRGGTWAATNKARVERLDAAGLLEPAGRAVIEAAQADGSWSLLDSVEALEEPDDLAQALDDQDGARAGWSRLSTSARKQLLWHVISAKRPETRARRVTAAVAAALAAPARARRAGPGPAASPPPAR